MTRLEALVALNTVSGLGTIHLKKLLEYFNRPEDILAGTPRKLAEISGIGTGITRQICLLKDYDLAKEFSLAQEYGLEVISFEDKNYPRNLNYIPDPPIVLYVKGKIIPEDSLALGIVGSRRATFYGLNAAARFAAELSGKGCTIVSGMARGIDTYAHRGALKRGGRTIAVMGSGFKHIYPAENKELAEEIARHGAVISEFPVDTGPLRQNFPRRNRVISGLSLGILVVEAARNSGALITADFALEQGREVFALPGAVNSLNSFGTNGLIQQGAKLVSSAEDILEEFEALRGVDLKPPEEKLRSNLKIDLNSEETLLYNLISSQTISLDDLVEKADIGVSRVSGILLGLEMKKLIKQLPGKQFIKVDA